MNISLALTYGILIAHFVPGTITLSALLLQFNKVSEFFSIIITKSSDSAIISVFLFVLAALFIGLIIDGVRFFLMDPLINKVWHVSRPEGLFRNIAGENLSAFQYLFETTWRHYQFYSNSCVCCLIIAISLFVPGRSFLYSQIHVFGTIILIVIAVLLFFAAGKTYKRFVMAFKEFSKSKEVKKS